ncbi:MAG: carbohydrate kinase family protein [Chloroflexi bacterium]|nr:carbohydrate kinase family protein [Chloroflexota bacterium]
MNSIEVAGLGALNVDLIYQVERILGDGETAHQEQVEGISRYREAKPKFLGRFPGGSAANTIYGLAKFGIKTGFVGVVGDDDGGKLLLQDFAKAGVDTSQIKVIPGAKTGSARCFSDKLNFRKIMVSPATANSLLAINDIDLDYLNQAKILHVSSFADDPQLDVLLELIAKLDSSVKVSFSPGALYASKGLPTLTPILAKTYVLFINESEIKELTGRDFNSGAKRCLDLGCHIVVVTLGEGTSYKTVMATSYIRTADGEYVVKPNDKSIISASDTVGAGDAFAAGFIYGLLAGKGPLECGRLGDIVARFSITRVGARQGLPTLGELTQRYQELYSKQP